MLATKESFFALFRAASHAAAFEESVLGVGREFLPDCARSVVDRKDPTPEYWDWLIRQVGEDASVSGRLIDYRVSP